MCGSAVCCDGAAAARWAAIADQASQPNPQADDCKNLRRLPDTVCTMHFATNDLCLPERN